MFRSDMLRLMKDYDPIIVSIMKWKDMRDYRTFDEFEDNTSPDNCALCEEYRKFVSSDLGADENEKGRIVCDECPVKARTGEDGCLETPYQDLLRILERIEDKDDHDNFKDYLDEILEAVESEIHFLRQLAKEGVK